TQRPPTSTLFPSRRSSDLALFVEVHAFGAIDNRIRPLRKGFNIGVRMPKMFEVRVAEGFRRNHCSRSANAANPGHAASNRSQSRSEEHTSELQSRENLVCR